MLSLSGTVCAQSFFVLQKCTFPPALLKVHVNFVCGINNINRFRKYCSRRTLRVDEFYSRGIKISNERVLLISRAALVTRSLSSTRRRRVANACRTGPVRRWFVDNVCCVFHRFVVSLVRKKKGTDHLAFLTFLVFRFRRKKLNIIVVVVRWFIKGRSLETHHCDGGE